MMIMIMMGHSVKFFQIDLFKCLWRGKWKSRFRFVVIMITLSSSAARRLLDCTSHVLSHENSLNALYFIWHTEERTLLTRWLQLRCYFDSTSGVWRMFDGRSTAYQRSL